ncbi:MAG: VOC family protein [Pseudomonadota bacterium]
MSEEYQKTILSHATQLMVSDIHRAVDFYTEKLGFSVMQIHGEPPSFAIAELGAVSIMLKQSAEGPRPTAASLSGMWDAYIWVRDIKAVENFLREKSVTLHRGPEVAPHGCTEIEVKDPDGHIIAFGYCP